MATTAVRKGLLVGIGQHLGDQQTAGNHLFNIEGKVLNRHPTGNRLPGDLKGFLQLTNQVFHVAFDTYRGQILRLVELLMGQGKDTALAFKKAGFQFRIAESLRLQKQQVRHYLQINLNPMMELLKQHRLLRQRGPNQLLGLLRFGNVEKRCYPRG